MKHIPSLLPMLFALALIAGVVAVITWFIQAFFQYVETVPTELAAPLIAGAVTIVVTTTTVMIGRYFERKKELDALYRDKKTEMYDAFLKEFFSLFYSPGEKLQDDQERDLVPFLQEFTRKLVLWSGPGVIEAFATWKDHLARGTPDAKSVFLTEAFLLAVRKDLSHSNFGLRRGFFARLFLRESALFLAMEQKNPNVTLDELAAVKKLYEGKTGA